MEVRENSLEDFVIEMMDEYTHPKAEKKTTSKGKRRKKVKPGSKISENEVKEAKKLLKEAANNDDWLLSIGMPIEEIDRYKIKKTDKSNEQGK